MKIKHLVDIICTRNAKRISLLFCLLALTIVLGLSSQAFSVDFLDYAQFACAWLTTPGQPDFNKIYDLDKDNDIDRNDLKLFVRNWLLGAKYPYSPPQTNRKKLIFNTGWKFYRGDISENAPKNFSYDDSSWQDVIIPHNPPMNPPAPDPLRPTWPNYSYEGVSWYRKHFNIDSSKQGNKIFIEFEAANTVTNVWINGNYLTAHYGGYLPFTVDITDYANFGPTGNVIAVKVDNTDNPDVPIGNSGWFNWGGIYRDTWLHITDKLHVTDAIYADIVAGGGIFVTYPSVTTAKAQVQVKTHIKNEYASARNCNVKTYIVNSNNKVVAQMADTQSISAGDSYTFTQLTEVTDPCLWHPNHPYLYTVYSEVYDDNSSVDTYQTQIGIRRINFTHDNGFEINGERMMFMGTNRMQDYPYVGYAMASSEQRRDAIKLREAGFQYVRTSHYPQDAAFMDACDELGILVMNAIPGFQYIGGTTFKNHSYQNMRDLIRRDRNHPCVIAWELSLNETDFDSTYARNAVDIGHAEYPGNQCFVSGWKFDHIYDVYIRATQHGARDYAGSIPLIISEYGHWGYGGNPSTSDVHRAEDLPGPYGGGEADMLQQAWNHQEGLHLNRGVSFLCGDGLWCGFDLACYPSGVLDTFRLPKFSYYFFQSQRDPNLIIPSIDSGPMVKISNYWTSGSPKDVRVYSNCDQVKLYLNNILIATQNPDTGTNTSNLLHPPFTFTAMSWCSGELKAEGYIGGQLAATDIVNTPGNVKKLAIRFGANSLRPCGDMTFIYVSILDSDGILVPDASNEIHLSISGPAVLINPADKDAEAGIATFLIQTTEDSDSISVSATSSGLTEDSNSILVQ